MTATGRTLLREAIRRMLSEAAGPGKSIELIDRLVALNSQLREAGVPLESVVTVFGDGPETEVFFSWRSTGADGERKVSRAEPDPSQILLRLGSLKKKSALEIIKANPHPYGSVRFASSDSGTQGPCLRSQIVQLTRSTRSGWGPLLYDVAMEVATQESSGLTSDRFDVSPDAQRVWDVYDTARPDVQSRQLDIYPDEMDLEGEELDAARKTRLTPRNRADDCAQDPAWQEEEENWMNSPLSRVYSKAPVALQRLKSEKLLVRM